MWHYFRHCHLANLSRNTSQTYWFQELSSHFLRRQKLLRFHRTRQSFYYLHKFSKFFAFETNKSSPLLKEAPCILSHRAWYLARQRTCFSCTRHYYILSLRRIFTCLSLLFPRAFHHNSKKFWSNYEIPHLDTLSSIIQRY